MVHAGLIIDPRRAPARVLHERNLIGTMNLVAACSGDDSPVRHPVVKSNTAVYGSEPDDPSFWSETTARHSPARYLITRSIDDVESYLREYAERHPRTEVTTLRFNVLGVEKDTAFASPFDLPLVPSVFGFDPRLQFVHHQDALAALEHAVTTARSATFNISGGRHRHPQPRHRHAGHYQCPGAALRRRRCRQSGLPGFPQHLLRLRQYGRVVNNTAMHEVLGFHPSHTTMATVADYARRRRLREIDAQGRGRRDEADLEAILGGKSTSTSSRPATDDGLGLQAIVQRSR